MRWIVADTPFASVNAAGLQLANGRVRGDRRAVRDGVEQRLMQGALMLGYRNRPRRGYHVVA